MFCPVGYINLSDIAGQISELSLRIGAAQYIAKTSKAKIENERQYFEGLVFEEALLACWLLCRFLGSVSPYAASPNGKIVKIGNIMICHEDQLGAYDWTWPVEEAHPGLFWMLKSSIEQKDVNYAIDRFRFLEMATGTISVISRQETIRKNTSQELESVNKQLEIARQFEGWSVVFDLEEVPAGVDDFLELIDFRVPYIQLADTSDNSEEYLNGPNSKKQPTSAIWTALKPKGRPQKREPIINFLQKHYFGQHLPPLKSIQKMLREKENFNASDRTVQRAKSEYGARLERLKR